MSQGMLAARGVRVGDPFRCKHTQSTYYFQDEDQKNVFLSSDKFFKTKRFSVLVADFDRQYEPKIPPNQPQDE